MRRQKINYNIYNDIIYVCNHDIGNLAYTTKNALAPNFFQAYCDACGTDGVTFVAQEIFSLIGRILNKQTPLF